MERRPPGIPPPWSPACESHPLHPDCCMNSNLCKMRKRSSESYFEEEAKPSVSPERERPRKERNCGSSSEDQLGLLLKKWLEKMGATEGGGMNAKEKEKCEKEKVKMEQEVRKMIDKWKKKSMKFPPECRTKLMKAYLQKMLDLPPESLGKDKKCRDQKSAPEKREVSGWSYWRRGSKGESQEEARRQAKRDPEDVLEEVRQLVRSCKAQCFANYAKSSSNIKTVESRCKCGKPLEKPPPRETASCKCAKVDKSPRNSEEQLSPPVSSGCKCSKSAKRPRTPEKQSCMCFKVAKPVLPSSDEQMCLQKPCCDCPKAKVAEVVHCKTDKRVPQEPCCKCRPPESPKKKPSTAWTVEEKEEVRHCTMCDRTHIKIIDITEKYLKASSEAQTELTSPVCSVERKGMQTLDKVKSKEPADSRSSDSEFPPPQLLACTYVYPSSPKTSKSMKHPDPAIFSPILKSFFNGTQS